MLIFVILLFSSVYAGQSCESGLSGNIEILHHFEKCHRGIDSVEEICLYKNRLSCNDVDLLKSFESIEESWVKELFLRKMTGCFDESMYLYLRNIVLKDSDAMVRLAAIYAVLRLKNPSAEDLLVRVCMTDKEDIVRINLIDEIVSRDISWKEHVFAFMILDKSMRVREEVLMHLLNVDEAWAKRLVDEYYDETIEEKK